MSHPRISVFAGAANGAAAPVRILEGQATLMARTSHDIGVDTARDEIVTPNPFAEAILFFKGGAGGADPPVRVIQGPNTKLEYTDNVAVDPQNGEVLTAHSRSNAILVFDRQAEGNVAPKRTIYGPKTQLNQPARVAVDPLNRLLVVAQRGEPAGLLIFERTADGDVAPKAIISGPKTGVTKEWRPARVTLYPRGRKIFLAVSGVPRREGRDGFVGIWTYEDTGDVAPWAIIRGTARTKLGWPFGGVALNPDAQEVMVLNNNHPPALLVYHLPEVFK